MEYIITGLVSLAVTMLSFMLQSTIKENRRLKKLAEEQHMSEYSAIREAILCLLRDRLIDMHRKYTQRGTIPMHGLQNWKSMHQAYTSLGGNGIIGHMDEEIAELHIE
jgi:hypothetical protein